MFSSSDSERGLLVDVAMMMMKVGDEDEDEGRRGCEDAGFALLVNCHLSTKSFVNNNVREM